MPAELVHPDFLNLIRSLKPYMGKRALTYVELTENLLELLATEQAQKVRYAFLSLKESQKPAVPPTEGEEMPMVAAPVGAQNGLGCSRQPFLLFLILILLLLSFDK